MGQRQEGQFVQSIKEKDLQTNQVYKPIFMDKKQSKAYQLQDEAIITFKNVQLDINIKKRKLFSSDTVEQKPILKSLSGYFCPGLNAILGSSGAGKTSLLNLIARRIENGEANAVQGGVYFNNIEYNFKKFNEFAGYVMQDDYLLPNLTVKEYLQFAADMQLKTPSLIKAAKVEEMIKLLQLQRCQDTLIGDQMFKGISGGERKRCSIGMELIGEPKVLILDEPTSGLDSFTSFKLISLLKRLAEEKNRTIIFTIHQPSSDIWNLFDRIFLMVDGKFIYQGPGQESIINHFNQVGFKCPKYSNPADYFMQIMSGQSDQAKQNIVFLIHQYEQTLQGDVEASINQLSLLNQNKDEVTLLSQNKTIVRGFQMVKTLIQRQIKTLSRNKVLVYGRLIQVIIMGLFQMAIYWKLNRDEEEFTSPKMISVYLYVSVCGMFLQSLNPQVINFSIERPIFLKEVSQNLYTAEGYLLSKILPELISCSLFPVLMSFFTYWSVGLTNEAGTYFFYLLVYVLQSHVGNAFGILAASLFDETRIAISFAMTFIVPQLLFGGLFKNNNDIRWWIRWIQYITPTYYALNATVVNEFEDTDFVYNPIEFLHLDLNKWFCVIMLVVLYFAFNLLAYIILIKKKKKLQ